MPELPEAETIARALRPRLEGRRVAEVRFLAPRAARGPLPPLMGRSIRQVRRQGKHVLLELDQGAVEIRLGMTGALLLDRAPGPYTRALLRLDDGTMLCFDDVRQFGWIGAAEPGAGPDPLELSAEEFARRLRSRAGQVKRLLLDQKFLSGLGNIYTDEALFRAGIHPRANTRRLSAKRAARLHQAIVEVLSQAIARRGSSVSDYIDAEGRAGEFQQFHLVYRKQGRPCTRCGTLIRRLLVAQRGTHYCPRCQRP